MKLALHSVGYAGVWPGQARLTLDEFIPRARSLGYDGVMLVAKRPHASLLDLTGRARKRLRQRLDDEGLALAAVAGYNDFCAGSEIPEVPLREMQILYLTELAQLAHDLGGATVRVFTGFDRASVSFDQQWEWCVQGLKEAARRAVNFGVTLAVQNHHDVAAHYDSLYDLLAAVDEPNCRAAFDAWSPALHGSDLVAGVRLLAPFIVHTTVADYVKRPRFKYVPRQVNYEPQPEVVRAVPMGEGFIDYPAFFDALAAIGYRGFVGYEMCSPLRGGGSESNLDDYARRFVAWMRDRGYCG